jgi:hypothetical protein
MASFDLHVERIHAFLSRRIRILQISGEKRYLFRGNAHPPSFFTLFLGAGDIGLLTGYQDGIILVSTRAKGESPVSALLIKSIPPDIHQRLRLQAERHHRSMNREVLAILEENLDAPPAAELPPPVRPLRPVSGEEIVRIIRHMRDQAR